MIKARDHDLLDEQKRHIGALAPCSILERISQAADLPPGSRHAAALEVSGAAYAPLVGVLAVRFFDVVVWICAAVLGLLLLAAILDAGMAIPG